MTAPRSTPREVSLASPALRARILRDPHEKMRDEVLAGLRQRPKVLPPKLFYDERGAALFDSITRLDEYYLTRTERAILVEHAHEIAACLGPRCVLIEYGSGEAEKVRLLLDHLRGALAPTAYIPIDISAEQLHRVTTEIAAAYPSVPVLPVAADYTGAFELPALSFVSRPAPRRVAFFPGSTIGNLHPPDARTFLHRVAQTCGSGGGLLLGADLKKDPEVLHAAYNDPGGITAAFNRNVLLRLNRELGGTFDPAHFRHYAYYNPIAGRVEMHLVSLRAQTVQVAGEWVSFESGESIWTESSYKYTIHDLELLAARSGFEVARVWTDPCRWFAVLYLVVTGGEARRGDLDPQPAGRAG